MKKIMKKVLFVVSLISVLLLTGCNEKNNNAINNNASGNIPKKVSSDQQILVQGEEYILEGKIYDGYNEKIEEYTEHNPKVNFDCEYIYFNNDDTPDMVVDNPGYNISIYTWNADTNSVAETLEWPYGSASTVGYEYYEKAGIITFESRDYNGAVVSDNMIVFDEKLNQKENLFHIKPGTKLEKQDLENMSSSEKATYEEAQKFIERNEGYYYNGEKVTAEKYNEKVQELMENVTGEKKPLTKGNEESI